MVRQLWLLIFVLGLAIQTSPAQQNSDKSGLDSLLTRERATVCTDYTFNARKIIPGLFERREHDSIYLVIDYVTSRCPDADFSRLLELMSIYEYRFDRDLCEDSLFLFKVFEEPRRIAGIWLHDWPWFEKLQSRMNSDFSQFENDLITLLLNRHESYDSERLMLLYLADSIETIVDELHEQKYADHCLQIAYNDRIRVLLQEKEADRANINFFSGGWWGTGGNEELGVKMELGMTVGGRWHRFGLDFIGLMRFLGPGSPYYVDKDGALISSNYYFGGLGAVELTYEIIRLGNNSFEIVGAGGYEGFGALADKEGSRRKAFGSFTGGGGLNYRWLYNPSRSAYLGLQVRYMVADYDNGAGTDLSGNAISVRLVWGRLFNDGVDRQLDRLAHYGR